MTMTIRVSACDIQGSLRVAPGVRRRAGVLLIHGGKSQSETSEFTVSALILEHFIGNKTRGPTLSSHPEYNAKGKSDDEVPADYYCHRRTSCGHARACS
jgi:hypothetical protein